MMIVESSGRASHLEVLRALRRLMRVLSQGTQKTRNSFWIRWTCITNIFEILTMFSIFYAHRFFGNSSQMCCCRLLRRSQMFPPAGNLSQSLQFRWVGLFSEQLNLNWKISQAARKALCSSGTPITLLSDMFDLLTLESCEELFKTVEQEVIIDLLQLTPSL